jgi:hypothetical protein
MTTYYLIFYRPIGSKCWTQWLGTDKAPFISAFADNASEEITHLQRRFPQLEFAVFEAKGAVV